MRNPITAIALALATCCSSSLAAKPTASPPAKAAPKPKVDASTRKPPPKSKAVMQEEVTDAVMQDWVQRLVGIGPGLEPSMQSDVERLTQLLLDRMRAVVAQTLSSAHATTGVWDGRLAGNRALHELTVLSRARLSEEHARLWQLALEDDAFCRPPNEEKSWAWSERFHAMRHLPPPQRARLMALEEALIRKFGELEPNSELPFDTDQMASQYRAGGPAGKTPWAPTLALHLLPTRTEHLSVGADVPRVVQCYAQQLAYRNAGADLKALERFRAGTALTLSWLLEYDRTDLQEKRPGDAAYPRLASEYGVSGSIHVSVSFGPSGKAVSARVSGRDLVAHGVPEKAVPYAFLDLLDEASIAHALRSQSTQDPKLFGKTAVVPYVWKFAE